MDKAVATFFRLFDIAFFAPGTILLTVLLKFGYVQDPGFRNLGISGEALTILLLIVSVYVLGLICHAIQRIPKTFLRIIRSKETKNDKGTRKPKIAWYRKLKSDDERYDLIMYFWYLRATCWNLAISLIFALLLMLPKAPIRFSIWGPTAVVAAMLFFLGFDFQRALRHAVENNGAKGNEGDTSVGKKRK